MALTRRVAATAVPQQHGAPGQAEAGTDRASLLDRVPTQRGAVAGSPPEVPELAGPDRRRGRRVLMIAAVTVSAALVVGSVVEVHQRTVRVTERTAADVRVAVALAAGNGDAAGQDAAQVAGRTAWSGAVSAAREAARGAAASGAQQLAAGGHADPALLAALQSAVERATSTAADPAASLATLSSAASGVAAPAQGVADAENAWQAEQARVAAEQQAAAEAAAKAAADAAAGTAHVAASTRPAARPATSSGTRTAAVPAAGGAVQAIPAGGLVCPGAPVGAGVGESSAAAIGAAINDFRVGNGLPALAVTRSGTLVAHAEDMAASGGIWHSGSDNIVGCTSGGVSSLITAWANSAPHRAQMLRTDVSVMKVGGATSGGWLYGAVKFS